MTDEEWKNWRNQPWADRGNKKHARRVYDRNELTEYQWRERNAFAFQQPEAFRAQINRQVKDRAYLPEGAIQQGWAVNASNYSLGSPTHQKQIHAFPGIIADLVGNWSSFASSLGIPTFHAVPQLCVWLENGWGATSGFGKKMETGTPDWIESNAESMHYLAEHSTTFRVLASHELAHILNKDTSVENWTKRALSQTWYEAEISADLLGAIIHGNPREYARLEFEYSQRHPVETYNEYNYSHISINARARLMHQWADRLERKGVTDKNTGEITDKEKAWAIYKQAKRHIAREENHAR